MKSLLKKQKVKSEKEIDNFTVLLIKVIGIAGVIIGIAILVSFWYWVIKMLYKIG
jgi:hypothetical protein